LLIMRRRYLLSPRKNFHALCRFNFTSSLRGTLHAKFAEHLRGGRDVLLRCNDRQVISTFAEVTLPLVAGYMEKEVDIVHPGYRVLVICSTVETALTNKGLFEPVLQKFPKLSNSFHFSLDGQSKKKERHKWDFADPEIVFGTPLRLAKTLPLSDYMKNLKFLLLDDAKTLFSRYPREMEEIWKHISPNRLSTTYLTVSESFHAKDTSSNHVVLDATNTATATTTNNTNVEASLAKEEEGEEKEKENEEENEEKQEEELENVTKTDDAGKSNEIPKQYLRGFGKAQGTSSKMTDAQIAIENFILRREEVFGPERQHYGSFETYGEIFQHLFGFLKGRLHQKIAIFLPLKRFIPYLSEFLEKNGIYTFRCSEAYAAIVNRANYFNFNSSNRPNGILLASSSRTKVLSSEVDYIIQIGLSANLENALDDTLHIISAAAATTTTTTTTSTKTTITNAATAINLGGIKEGNIKKKTHYLLYLLKCEESTARHFGILDENIKLLDNYPNNSENVPSGISENVNNRQETILFPDIGDASSTSDTYGLFLDYLSYLHHFQQLQERLSLPNVDSIVQLLATQFKSLGVQRGEFAVCWSQPKHQRHVAYLKKKLPMELLSSLETLEMIPKNLTY